MADYNRVILMGRLTRDVELRYVGSGTAVSDVGVAVNDRRKNANGEWIEETQFVDVTLWGRTAEVANQYLSKGSPIFIEGRLKFDQWENKEGEKRSKLRVVGDRLQLMPRAGGSGGGNFAPPRDENEYSQPAAQFEEAGVGAGTQPQEGGKDIPF